MHLKGLFLFFVFAVIILVQYASALPRDIGVNIEAVSQNPDLTKKVKDIPNETGSEPFGIASRVTCPYEEATDYTGCQAHCLPKGYSYGICVSGTCSCI